jgi:hypothetical protein
VVAINGRDHPLITMLCTSGDPPTCLGAQMSDETPTERFDAAGDSPHFTGAADASPTTEVVEERKSRRLIIILGSIGGALLVILIILLIVLLVRPGGAVTPTGTPTPTTSPTATSSASPTPTPTAGTPTPTPTPTPTQTVAPPPSNDVEIDSFDATPEVDCSSQTQNPEYIEFSWSSTNGIVAYFAVGAVDNAETNGMGWTLPPNGSTADFPSGYVPYEFQCGNTSQTYTITIVGTNGSRESAQVTVTNVGDTF